MSDALEDFVTVVIGELWKGKIDPARPGWWKLLEKRDQKTMANEPPSFHEQDGNDDIMDAGFLGGQDMFSKAKKVVGD